MINTVDYQYRNVSTDNIVLDNRFSHSIERMIDEKLIYADEAHYIRSMKRGFGEKHIFFYGNLSYQTCVYVSFGVVYGVKENGAI